MYHEYLNLWINIAGKTCQYLIGRLQVLADTNYTPCIPMQAAQGQHTASAGDGIPVTLHLLH